MPVEAIRSVEPVRMLDGRGTSVAEVAGGRGEVKSFSDILGQAIGEVNQLQSRADASVKTLAAGGDIDVHQVMIAMEQASTALQLTLQVRNRVMDAYTEVMRTQV